MRESSKRFYLLGHPYGLNYRSAADIFASLPVIETPRLVLRMLRMKDAADVFAFSRNPQVARYCLWTAHRSVSESRAYIRHMLRQYRQGAPSSWAIVEKTQNRVIGTIGYMLYIDDSGCAQIGYSLAQESWGNGFATEALQAVIKFSFEQLNCNRVEAQHDVRNPASGRVMEKCGMTPEGIFRNRYANKGDLISTQMWSILRNEYIKQNRTTSTKKDSSI